MSALFEWNNSNGPCGRAGWGASGISVIMKEARCLCGVAYCTHHTALTPARAVCEAPFEFDWTCLTPLLSWPALGWSWSALVLFFMDVLVKYKTPGFPNIWILDPAEISAAEISAAARRRKAAARRGEYAGLNKIIPEDTKNKT